MKYLVTVSLVAIVFFTTWPFSKGSYAGNAPAAVTPTATSATAKPDIRYEKALLTARINRVPLAEVSDDLAVKTGVRSHLYDPAMADELVSVFIDAMPLEAGIKEIFAGFSYVLYSTADGYVVIVLSTQPNNAIDKSGPAIGPITQSESGVMPETPYNAASAPQSLDEFQPITENEFDVFADEDDESIDPLAYEIMEQEQNEALLDRALDVLQSSHKHLHMQAIEELAGLEGPSATEALAETATRNGMDTGMRIQIVEALWQRAADRESTDTTALAGLEKLAKDNDNNLRSIAQQALENL